MPKKPILKVCDPVFTFNQREVESIGKLYPYCFLIYTDLKEALLEFLETRHSADDETQVIAISQHNGRGGQWGVVLIKKLYESEWRMVGQFGHCDNIPWKFYWPVYFNTSMYWLQGTLNRNEVSSDVRYPLSLTRLLRERMNV